MSSADIIEAAGGLIALGFVIEALLKGGFCAREMPTWLRVWTAVAGAMLGTRLLTRENQPVSLSDYWVAAIYVHFAVAVAVGAGWAILVTVGPGGDRCPLRLNPSIPSMRGRLGHVVAAIAAVLIALAAILYVFW